MLIKTFGSKEKSQTSGVVHLSIKLLDGKDMQTSAHSVPLICEPLTGQTEALAKNMYEHLSGLHLADYSTESAPADVDVLIGSDQYWQLVHTRLGWVLSGPVEGSTHNTDPSVNLVSSIHVLRCASEPTQPESNGLIGELKRFWDLGSLRISSSEQSVYNQFINTITFQCGRYEVHLPWKDAHPILPDNYETSLKRLQSLLHRHKDEPNVLLEHDVVIREQIENGNAERVSKPETGEVGRVHYSPHHAVIRRDKETTKLRIVYDVSCKSSGTSLKDCLFTGPSLSQKIVDIILRCRTHRKAFVGDIEKPFLNVSVAEQDRDVLSFLWVDDVRREIPEIVVLWFARVVFGVLPSPFLLNATVKHHTERYKEEDPDFVETFLRTIYVDDLSTGGDSDEVAYQLYVKSRLRLAESGFNLRKFVTNSADLRNRIEENETILHGVYPVPPTREEDASDKANLKATTVSDPTSKLKFDLSKVAKQASESIPTKRNIASTAAKFYDPIGFLSSVVVQFKLLFQDLCSSSGRS